MKIFLLGSRRHFFVIKSLISGGFAHCYLSAHRINLSLKFSRLYTLNLTSL